jgi:hypothetical protein
MRKLLMASTAILGASAGLALAQTTLPANQAQGQYVAPYGAGPATNNNNNAWGIANTPSGSAAAGPNSTIKSPNVNAVPAPGTVVIRLNGLVSVEMGAMYTSANTYSTPGGTYKVNPVGIAQYARLYPGFDGVAANGLRYGASIEIRENYSQSNFPGTLTGTSTPSTTSLATSPSTNSSAETLFIRRAFTYMGSDQLGIVRFGQGDGVIGLLNEGWFDGQNMDFEGGPFNGGDLQGFAPAPALGIPFVFVSLAGAEYGNDKIVYMSPQYYGFDFGVQYAPNMGNTYQYGAAGASGLAANPNSIGLTSGNDPTRWYNQVAVGGRYQQTFGAVDFKIFAVYETASKNQLTVGSYQPASTPVATRSSALTRYDNLSWYTAGAGVTAFNVTAAIDYVGGADNGQISMRPTGGAPMAAFIGSLIYANGPWRGGIEYMTDTSQGAAVLYGVSQRNEYGLTGGISYAIAPGVSVTAEYVYQHRHQGDYNFNTGVAGTGTVDAQGQGAMFATTLTW